MSNNKNLIDSHNSSYLLNHSQQTLSTSTELHLMPFSISHHGPAKISTYFLPRPIVPVDQSSSSSQGCLEAAFRGRYIHGTPVSLPERYTGLLLSSSSTPAALPALIQTKPANPRPARTARGRGRGRGAGAAMAAARMKAKTAETTSDQFIDESDPEDETRNARRAEKVETRQNRQSLAQLEAGQLVEAVSTKVIIPELSFPAHERVAPVPSSPDDHKTIEAGSTKVLKAVGTFNEFVIWNPDGPLDCSEDVYFRSITEWTAMAELLHRPPPKSASQN
ncbi:hypothetical protein CROQUDRAFT_650666 [Cronartium quercuum f. sp. fusiforme G11]|uniref:Uncharacterized protein n=1 Tax=Cronartium quercuum f. sp. fusiforme G11 TaxID=708437 RepID=A0A9P6NXM1_9BASI|nr:hypothetical protein CROQUDRAFT_650666 [Cronartium quercuum f. sp. fusiforme G11]